MSEMATESGERKPCRHCAELVKPEARLCPYCGRLQKGIYLPLDAVLMIFAAAFALGTFFFCAYLIEGGRDFAEDRGKLIVVSSRLSVDGSKEKRVTLSGIVTNQSDHAWSRLEFDVRFYATNGALIDVFESAGDWFSVGSHDEHSFSLNLFSYRIRQDYASHQVSVRSARDPRNPGGW